MTFELRFGGGLTPRLRRSTHGTKSKIAVPEAGIEAVRLPIPASHGYSPPMPDKLDDLLERLKAQQRDLIWAMVEHDGLPAGSVLRQVAELENVIAAVEAMAAEETDRQRTSG